MNIALSAIIFFAYIAYIGVLPSISDSFKKVGWWFYLWCIAVSLPIMLEGAWFFASGASLCFVGAAAEFWKPLTKKVHFTAAFLSIVFAIIGLVFLNWIYLVVPIGILIMIALILYKKISNPIYWVEIISYTFILIALIYSKL